MTNSVITADDIIGNKKLARQFSYAAKSFPAINWAAEKDYALQLFSKSARLRKCTRFSMRTAILDAARCGLTLSPTLRHAYLIPWKNNDTNEYEVQFTPSYMGLESMVLRAGTVAGIQSAVVRKNDMFKVYVRDGRRTIDHAEKWDGDRGPMIAAYCIANYANGERHIEVMDAAAIDGCKKAATRINGGKTPFTWADNNPFLEEMWKKCVVRRAAKHWPQDSEGMLAMAVATMNKAEPMDFGDSSGDAKTEEQELLISDAQETELHIFLEDRGIDKPGDWLRMLSKSMGYTGIEELPVRRLQEARDRLQTRIDAVKERHA